VFYELFYKLFHNFQTQLVFIIFKLIISKIQINMLFNKLLVEYILYILYQTTYILYNYKLRNKHIVIKLYDVQ
jgi:hypothetical protein